jgi:hypothetical protein
MKRRIAKSPIRALVSFLDGTPLVVSGLSKDPDVGCGWAAGRRSTHP